MSAFLEKLSKHIYHTYKDKLGDTCIVLPNRRAALFIRRYLGQTIEKTSFLPAFYSIEDFVAENSGLLISDMLSLQFTLYDIHRSMEQEDTRSLEDFLPYASWMISDFNDIDMYLVDPDKLFSFLGDAKAISLWHLDGKPLSKMEERYLSFFRSLNDYYHALNRQLIDKGNAYQAMAFRKMAENIDMIRPGLKWHKIIFAGFNALTNAEETIIRHLIREDKAEVFWDADVYYTRDKRQEAGTFLRRYFSGFSKGKTRWEEDHFSNKKDIEVIGVPKNAGQVKFAGELIRKLLAAGESTDNTAVVLPDETLLVPLLSSIPPEAGPFNVTMGLPLSATPLFTLADNLLSLHQNAERHGTIRSSSQAGYYLKDLLRIFNHPWFRVIMRDAGIKDPVPTLKAGSRLFFSISEIHSMAGTDASSASIFKALFPGPASVTAILDSLNRLTELLRAGFIAIRKASSQEQGIELEYLFRFSSLLKRIRDLLEEHGNIDNTRTLRLVIRQMAATQKIPFYGEPLKGLQVMGMLETRTLDFDTLIILSMNEGVLPSGHSANTFIPFEIKQNFGLPTYKDNNAVFAYHFYRLVQRAGKVFLLYNTEPDQLGGGEKSRFITQMLHELKSYNPEIRISEKILSMPAPASDQKREIVVQKDESVMALLRREAQSGLHPSSLSRYIRCPLQFYFSRLIRIRETEEIDENIDNRVLGIVMHESLYQLLKPYRDKPLDTDALKDTGKSIGSIVREQFTRVMGEGDLDIGKNHLILNVAIKMLQQFIRKEASWLKDSIPLSIKDLELHLEASLGIPSEGNSLRVKITGTADRIDRKGEWTRVLDYKTGFVKDSQLKPGTWEKLTGNPDYEKAFQLMLYSWLYHQNHQSESNISAGIISLRMPGNGPIKLLPPDGGALDPGTLKIFRQHLEALLSEIFDPDTAFIQTGDEKTCSMCIFREICNK